MRHLRSFKLLLNILTLASLLASPIFVLAEVEDPAYAESSDVATEVIVKYENNEDISIISVPDQTPIQEVIDAIEENPNVEYAEPNFTRKLFDLGINDPQANLLWGHEIIDLGDAWQLSTGSQDVLVAVIDTGVLYTHPDLTASMWGSPSCLNENASTTTCVHGYDIVNNDSDPLPVSFHGTHVSGIIAATRNNNLGVAGVAPRAKIVALRIFDENDEAGVDDEVRAIDFAIQNGIKIINASYGGSASSTAEYDAIKRFRDAGGIFIAAAGNSSRNSDSGTHNYPSDYDLENIISVAATDQDDNLASLSNWGTTSVDVGAPGIAIRSTALNDGYADASGTSMATPYVAGLVALLWSVEPSLTYAQVRERIITRGDAIPSLASKTVTGRRVNAYNTLSTTTPVAILNNLPATIDTSSVPGINVTVSGGDVSSYKYKLDGGTWSTTTSISTAITAESLLNATHTLSVIAGSAWNLWQPEASSTDYTWAVNDATSPTITGLSDDATERTEKAWSWASNDTSATYRFEVSSSSTLESFTTSYSIATSTTASSPLGTVYIHVQAKDNNGNESATTTVSAVLVSPPPPAPAPAPSHSSGGGGGGGGSGGGAPLPSSVTKAGDLTGDSKVDLLDFNNLMVNWASRTSAFVDFNNLMINWTL